MYLSILSSSATVVSVAALNVNRPPSPIKQCSAFEKPSSQSCKIQSEEVLGSKSQGDTALGKQIQAI